MHKLISKAAALFLGVCGFFCTAKEQQYFYSEPAAGTIFTLRCYSAEPPQKVKKGVQAAFECIKHWETVLSARDARSELSSLNTAPTGKEHAISKELESALLFALRMAEKSNGNFDPTLGPVIRLWRRAARIGTAPSQEELKQAGHASGYKKLLISHGKAVKTVPGMYIDLSGMGKGYMLDRAAEELHRYGIASYLLSSTSDYLAGDPPPNQQSWKISVNGEITEIVREAISVSGGDYQSASIDGTEITHIVNSKTKMGVPKKPFIVVKASTAAEADALATGKFAEK